LFPERGDEQINIADKTCACLWDANPNQSNS